MHRRKHFLVYPPNYEAFKNKISYKVVKSNLQAKKLAYKLGVGTWVVESIQSHPKKFTFWDASWSVPLFEVVSL